MVCLYLQVKFKVIWDEDKTTLFHFGEFARNFFASLGKPIDLIEVCHSLIEFVCSTPFSATGALIKIVEENQQFLIELGVICIKVGDRFVFKVLKYIYIKLIFL